MTHPQVLDERATLEAVLTGKYRGFTRYGDGDFTVMRGQGELYQKWTPELAWELGYRLNRPVEGVLNCLPRPVTEGETQFYYRWIAYSEANAGLISMLSDQVFGSSYVSRMDSVPELHTEGYWAHVARLWIGRDVTLVRGSERSLTKQKLLGSPSPPRSVKEVFVPFRNSWDQYDETCSAVCAAERETVLLCAGLMSRPLTHRLVRLGHQVFDLGHLGLYFDAGKPRVLAECR